MTSASGNWLRTAAIAVAYLAAVALEVALSLAWNTVVGIVFAAVLMVALIVLLVRRRARRRRAIGPDTE